MAFADGGPRTVFTETEPNGTKAQANAFTVVDGDMITGTSTSSSGVGLDYFKVKTGPLPLGVYRHRFVITTNGSSGHVGTIHGLSQSGGVINPSSNVIVQMSVLTTSPQRFNQWYGFGKEEEIYYRVYGASYTTQPYMATMSTVPVAVTNVPGSFNAGSITITTDGQGHTTDTDLWVYDENLNAIVDYGNDDIDGGIYRSRLTRTYAAGTYYLAVSNSNFANNLASPADDAYRGGVVMDFANAAANSSASFPLSVSFSITDSTLVPVAVSSSKSDAFDINWFRFVVGTPPTGACCRGATCTMETEAGCVSTGGTFMGLTVSCTPNPCAGACCFADASCLLVTDAAACTSAGGIYFSGLGTSCEPNLCPRAGDNCINPRLITLPADGLPYVHTDTTCGRGNDYQETCLGEWDGGEDFLYKLVLTEAQCVNISLTGTLDYVGLAVFTACPPGAGCVEYRQSWSAGNPMIRGLDLSAGTYYIMIDTWLNPICTPFTMTITECLFPPHDLCVNAKVITSVPYNDSGLDSDWYLATDDPVGPSCDYITLPYANNGMWYRHTPAVDCVMGVWVTSEQYSATSIWTGADCSNLTEVYCSVSQPLVYPITGGVTYWILVSVVQDYEPTAAFSVLIDTGPLPNDDCPNAIAVTDGTPAATGYNCLANETDGAEVSCQENSNKDVWYAYQATYTGSVHMNTEGSAQSDTVLSVHASCGGSEIACDDDGGTGSLSSLSFQAVQGVTYYVRVASFYWTCGGFKLNIYYTPGVCCGPDGTCQVTMPAECVTPSIWHSDWTSCQPNLCLQLGACCFEDSHCEQLMQAACTAAGGTSWTMGQACVPNPCPQPCALMGDLNNDTYVNGLDIQGFVGCVLGGGLGCPCGNFDDSNLVVDLDDLTGFIEALLAP
jgi:hypothetical protein